MKTISLCSALLLTIGTPYQAAAELIDLQLDFSANDQSIWGPDGSSANFGYSGSRALGPVSFGYDIGASTGTVSALFSGDLSVDFASFLTTPGVTSIDLSFLGDAGGGQLESDLGFWVDVYTGSLSILWGGHDLHIEEGYTPQIDQQMLGSDSATVGNTGLPAIVAEVGANFDIEQTDTFMARAIDGLLAYELRGSGDTNYMPFSLESNAGMALDLFLGDYGTWDFWFVDVMLDNVFSTSFDAELVLYEEHITGIGWCGPIIGGYPCADYDRNETTLADIDVYGGHPFSLEFNDISSTSRFSIEVGTVPVPEPSTLALFGLGLLGMGLAQRKKV